MGVHVSNCDSASNPSSRLQPAATQNYLLLHLRNMAALSTHKLWTLLSLCSLSLSLLLLIQVASADDPADSWLAYTVAKGNGKMVTFVNATWTVPDYPNRNFGGNAPGWWFGIEPEPAADLIQPILAWGDFGPEYTIFNGYYQWDNGYWWQGHSHVVKPGQTIYAYVKYLSSNNTYDMFISCIESGWSVTDNKYIESGKVYTDVYFVVEHQPDYCSAYPANGEVTFKSIYIEWENQSQDYQWEAYKYQPACNSTPHVIDSHTVQFTWNPKDQ